MNRVIWMVIDSVGVGALKDSEKFGDVGVNTLGNIVKNHSDIKIPNMIKLGLGNIDGIDYLPKEENPIGCFGKCDELSCGKDTTTGHWEMTGVIVEKPFKTFPDGFTKDIIDEFEKRTGRKVVGNKPASGTAILDEYGEHQMKTGDMIVYTSADSVLQICGHEETFGLDELYRCCEIARELTLRDEYKVGRVIARPYIGEGKGHFVRTSNRHDYALKPYGRTVLNVLKDNGYDVISVGKINDIFDGEGITESNKSKSSVHGMEQTLEIMDRDFKGLCFVNLVDFDALWGHRRNPAGYAEELEKFDVNLGKVIEKLSKDDLLIITADHGNDPTYTGSDHTREYVPFLAYSPAMSGSGVLGEKQSFATIGATVADNFNLEMPENTIGESVLNELI